MKNKFRALAIACAALTVVMVACDRDNGEEATVMDTTPLFAPKMTLDSVTWAAYNVDDYQTFAVRPDIYTKFYQWNDSTAWAATGKVSGFPTADIYDTSWTVNPCPEGWRMPTIEEFFALDRTGSTWAAANTRGNAVAGRFCGAKHATCSLAAGGSMDSCIFLPASGYRYYTNGELHNQGINGIYWSNTHESLTKGHYMVFGYGSHTHSAFGCYYKARGYSIRCVQ